ncbi:uncharacterized protein BDW43DRAFT_287267 [Aspergillus alliaceus]|uniref:uncharacterized protein n=1 Tax=Petromyces alliaceus TaxID=209559 RepID=UPI0012A5023A|nr:uncharacterized protein BDW43DRAFT_287267 [Aspergillus alliaceus]KAB8229891.1 hypothetical protein BDW43DRAFT_287267 [Aspergillus alliaceus]
MDAYDIKYEPGVIRPALSARGYSEQEQEEWENDLTNGQNEDPWLALLIPLLPNLQCLTMTFENPSTHVRKVLKRALGGQWPLDSQPLAYLREISVQVTDCELEYYGVPTSDALLFFGFPSIQSFRAECIADCDEDEYCSPEALCGFSTITNIDLRKGNSKSGMRRLIRACAKLESFRYEHEITIGPCDDFNPAAFHASLLHHKDTLQRLTLVFNKEEDYRPGQGGEDNFFGSLSQFTALREICLRAPNLLDLGGEAGYIQTRLVDVLPSSLQRLAIEDFHQCDMNVLTAELEDCVLNMTSRFPCLHTLQIGGYIHEYDPVSADLTPPGRIHIPCIAQEVIQITQRLQFLCQAVGVKLRLWSREIEDAIAHKKEIEEEGEDYELG